MIGRCHVQHYIDVFVLTIDLPVADLNAGSILSPPSSRLTGGSILKSVLRAMRPEQAFYDTWIMTLRPAAWLPLGPTRMGLATWRLGKKNPDQLGGALS